MYDSKYMPFHAIGSVIGIFVVCAVLDMLRIKFVETPFFCLWDKHYGKIKHKILKLERKILSKICQTGDGVRPLSSQHLAPKVTEIG